MKQDQSTPSERRRSVKVLYSLAHQDSESDGRRHNKKDAACPIKLACAYTTNADLTMLLLRRCPASHVVGMGGTGNLLDLPSFWEVEGGREERHMRSAVMRTWYRKR